MSSCSRPRFRAPLLRGASLFVALAASSGCDIPTDLPIFDVRWVLPVEETSISVTEFLPTNVTVAAGNFDVSVAPVVLSETLGSICPLCVNSGVPVPKPAFTINYSQTGNLPADVVSAQLVSGSISLAIQNNLGFDPINPAPASSGTFTVTLYDTDINGRPLGQVTLDGATGGALPPGPTTIPLTLAPGTISSAIFAVVDLVSPAGDPVLIDVNAAFDITATVVSFLVSSATLNVDGRPVSISATNLDAGGINDSITDRILSGSLILDVQNPFGVGVTMLLDISGPGFMTIQKNVTIGSAATSSVTVPYTPTEWQTFLGQSGVSVSGAGTVVSPGIPATVTPAQVMTIEVTVDLILEVS